MTSNKIELNTDFDALLLSAQAKHKAYLDEVNKYRPSYDVEKFAYPSCIKNKIETAYEEWNSWMRKTEERWRTGLTMISPNNATEKQ